MTSEPDVSQAIPFLAVSNMALSLRFYVDGLGFEIADRWIDGGSVRWRRVRRGRASLMLQDFRREGGATWQPDGPLGVGVSTVFLCSDALALYREFQTRGLAPTAPFVGNGMWVIALHDPDGHRIEFESPTDLPEDTAFADEPATGGA